MKKILLFVFIFLVAKISFAQYPQQQTMGTNNTIINLGNANGGAIKGNIINGLYTDTTAANATQIDFYTGAQIFTTSDTSFWIRNKTATNQYWFRVGGASGGATGSFWSLTGNLFPVILAGYGIGSNDATNVPFKSNNVTRATIASTGIARVSGGQYKYVVIDTAGVEHYLGYADAGGSGGTPGGSNTQVQYNNSGAFGGITGATTNGTVMTLTSPVINVASDATGDIYYRSAGGLFTRLPIGTVAQRLGVVAGLPAWTDTAAAGITQLTGDVTAGPGSGSQAATVKIPDTRIPFGNSSGNMTTSAKFTMNTNPLYAGLVLGGGGITNSSVTFTNAAATNEYITNDGGPFQMVGSTTYKQLNFLSSFSESDPLLSLKNTGGIKTGTFGADTRVLVQGLTGGASNGQLHVEGQMGDSTSAATDNNGHSIRSIARYYANAGSVNTFYSSGHMGNTNAAHTQGHIAHFQSDTKKTGANTLGIIYHAAFLGDSIIAGTVTNRYGVYMFDAWKNAGATLTNQYGIYIPSLTAATNNYGAYFENNVGVATATPDEKLSVVGNIKASNKLLAIGAEADISSWSTINSSGLASTTNTPPGIRVFSGGAGSLYGMNLGYFSGYGLNMTTGDGSSFFWTRGGGALHSNFTRAMTLNASDQLSIAGGLYVGSATTAPTTKLQVAGSFAAEQGADVAAANNLAVVANVTEITGATQINLIANTGWVNGSEITLMFSSTPTVKHGQATSGSNITILLAGAADFVASSNDLLTLVLGEIGGTQAWREKSRSVN